MELNSVNVAKALLTPGVKAFISIAHVLKVVAVSTSMKMRVYPSHLQIFKILISVWVLL